MSCHLSFTPLPFRPKNIIVGSLSGQSNTQLATNAIAPYASELIGDTFDHTGDPNKAAQLLSHAILGAIIARVNGSNATSGAASAVVSEETSMSLARDLYPESFDANGNFDRSQLSEEQANGILALSSAIGAFTSGLSGGSVYDASIGGFVGQNAVEENKLQNEAEEDAKKWQEQEIMMIAYQQDINDPNSWFAVDPYSTGLQTAYGANAAAGYYDGSALRNFNYVIDGLAIAFPFGGGIYWEIKALGYTEKAALTGGLVSGTTGFGIGYTSSVGFGEKSPKDFIKSKRDDYIDKTLRQKFPSLFKY